MTKVSIAIATYEANGFGAKFIEKNINCFLEQTYEDIQLVISDHSRNDDIHNVVKKLSDDRIKYVRYEFNFGDQVQNINNAISNCDGEFIKLLNHDDYMDSPDTISDYMKLIEKGYSWVISSCKHLNIQNGEFYNFHTPKLENDGSHFLHGINYFGCPSVALIPKNEFLDANVKYMGDCELWFRLLKKYGIPGFLDGYKIVICTGSHTLTEQFKLHEKEMIEKDIRYCKLKYENIN